MAYHGNIKLGRMTYNGRTEIVSLNDRPIGRTVIAWVCPYYGVPEDVMALPEVKLYSD